MLTIGRTHCITPERESFLNEHHAATMEASIPREYAKWQILEIWMLLGWKRWWGLTTLGTTSTWTRRRPGNNFLKRDLWIHPLKHCVSFVTIIEIWWCDAILLYSSTQKDDAFDIIKIQYSIIGFILILLISLLIIFKLRLNIDCGSSDSTGCDNRLQIERYGKLATTGYFYLFQYSRPFQNRWSYP